MVGKTHLAAGIAAGAAICLTQQLGAVPGAIYLAGAGLGSLLPDIDHRNSTISKVAKPVGIVVNTVAGHRTIFHDPVMYMILGLLCYWLRPEWMVFCVPILIGVASHLFLDFLNPAGIPIIALARGPKIHLIGIHTGSSMDHFLGGVFSVIGRLTVVIWAVKQLLIT